MPTLRILRRRLAPKSREDGMQKCGSYFCADPKDLEEVASKPPEYTYVVIEEIPRTDWGHKGVLFSDK